MPRNITARFNPVPVPDFTRFRPQKNIQLRPVFTMRARIRDDLKAGGTLQGIFTAALTPQGISIDITA